MIKAFEGMQWTNGEYQKSAFLPGSLFFIAWKIFLLGFGYLLQILTLSGLKPIHSLDHHPSLIDPLRVGDLNSIPQSTTWKFKIFLN